MLYQLIHPKESLYQKMLNDDEMFFLSYKGEHLSIILIPQKNSKELFLIIQYHKLLIFFVELYDPKE